MRMLLVVMVNVIFMVEEELITGVWIFSLCEICTDTHRLSCGDKASICSTRNVCCRLPRWFWVLKPYTRNCPPFPSSMP